MSVKHLAVPGGSTTLCGLRFAEHPDIRLLAPHHARRTLCAGCKAADPDGVQTRRQHVIR